MAPKPGIITEPYEPERTRRFQLNSLAPSCVHPFVCGHSRAGSRDTRSRVNCQRLSCWTWHQALAEDYPSSATLGPCALHTNQDWLSSCRENTVLHLEHPALIVYT